MGSLREPPSKALAAFDSFMEHVSAKSAAAARDRLPPTAALLDDPVYPVPAKSRTDNSYAEPIRR